MLNLAQKRLENYKNVQCQLYDADSLNYSVDTGLVDIVCGVDIIHHIQDPTKALSAWRKMTQPNGILLFLECNPANPAMYIRHYNRPEEKRLYLNNKKNLTSWVTAAGWKNVTVKNLPTYLPSGPEKMSNILTTTEEFIHKIPLINRMSALFLVYAENVK
jgi:ubiquinone/menaquinone biosynthesis C-methylase UbiE